VDLKIGAGDIRGGHVWGTKCPNFCRSSSWPTKTNVNFVVPSPADRNYVIFGRLVLADGNCIQFPSACFKTYIN
jgi:hypothetical protein